jgi:hypothetical protein
MSHPEKPPEVYPSVNSPDIEERKLYYEDILKKTNDIEFLDECLFDLICEDNIRPFGELIGQYAQKYLPLLEETEKNEGDLTEIGLPCFQESSINEAIKNGGIPQKYTETIQALIKKLKEISR